MFYLIIGILLLLYYFFAAPQSIKGTLNSVTLVGLGVAVMILIVTGMIQVFRLPTEFFVSAVMAVLGYVALKDVNAMPEKIIEGQERKPRRRFTLKKVFRRK